MKDFTQAMSGLTNLHERTSTARRDKISLDVGCWYVYCTKTALIAGTFFPVCGVAPSCCTVTLCAQCIFLRMAGKTSLVIIVRYFAWSILQSLSYTSTSFVVLAGFFCCVWLTDTPDPDEATEPVLRSWPRDSREEHHLRDVRSLPHRLLNLRHPWRKLERSLRYP